MPTASLADDTPCSRSPIRTSEPSASPTHSACRTTLDPPVGSARIDVRCAGVVDDDVVEAGCVDLVGRIEGDLILTPDTVTVAQWPVIVTVLAIPSTLTWLSLHAIVLVSLTPATLSCPPGGVYCASAVRHRWRHRRGEVGVAAGVRRRSQLGRP